MKLSLAPVALWVASQMRATVGEWKETRTRSWPQVISTAATSDRRGVSASEHFSQLGYCIAAMRTG